MPSRPPSPVRLATLALAVLFAAGPASAASFDASSYVAGTPIVAWNLALVPLETRREPPYDDYTVLEEAQRSRSVTIREVEGGGEVPWLTVKNADPRPLYMLGGELVLGGNQDRMLVQDTVLDPKERRRVEVRCVEHGRWDGAALTFAPAGVVAEPNLRRLALFAGQGDVWHEVARKEAATGTSSDTGTYRRVVQDATARRRIGEYLDTLEKQIPESGRTVGVAVAIDGELEVVDLFDSPLLFHKLERKLLASYVLAALEKQHAHAPDAAKQAKARALGKADVDRFLGTGQTPQAQAPSEGKTFDYKGKSVHGTYFKRGGPATPNGQAK